MTHDKRCQADDFAEGDVVEPALYMHRELIDQHQTYLVLSTNILVGCSPRKKYVLIAHWNREGAWVEYIVPPGVIKLVSRQAPIKLEGP